MRIDFGVDNWPGIFGKRNFLSGVFEGIIEMARFSGLHLVDVLLRQVRGEHLIMLDLELEFDHVLDLFGFLIV